MVVMKHSFWIGHVMYKLTVDIYLKSGTFKFDKTMICCHNQF